MRVKKDQYMRYDDNRIEKANGNYDIPYCIKTAKTPQELVEVGDWILIKGFANPLMAENWVGDKEKIAAIYTPNADRTVYTEQWRVNDAK